MIVFASEKQHNLVEIKQQTVKAAKTYLDKMIQGRISANNLTLGFDIEATDLDAYKAQPLLWIFADETDAVIFDYTVDVLPILQYLDEQRFTLVGHNLKYDYKIIKVFYDYAYRNLWDTMIAECRICQNTGYRFGMDSVVLRRLGTMPTESDKRIRLEFVGNKDMIFEDKHIKYAANDGTLVFQLKEYSEAKIKELNLEFLVYEIEFPLVSILGDFELNGFTIDEDKWSKNIEDQRKRAYEAAKFLDTELRNLRDGLLLDSEKRLHLTGGKYDRERVEYYIPEQKDLFGNTVSIEKALQGGRKKAPKVKTHAGNVNWNSTTEIIKIMAILELEMPTTLELVKTAQYNFKERYVCPLPYNEKYQKEEKFTTNKTFLEAFQIARPEIPHSDLLAKIIEYRGAETLVSSFGKNFFEKKNPITGRYHTQYLQAHAVNSRFRSGGGDKEPDKFNGQNIPKRKEYRECFGYKEGYRIATLDLAGAEVTIMADKAYDHRLLELTSEDIHSHMAMLGWRNIYLYRAGTGLNLWRKAETFWNKKDDPSVHARLRASTKQYVIDNYNLSQTYVISKTENKHKRKPAKNLTFGSIYGAGAGRAGKTINVSVQEGDVYIRTIKGEIPETFAMVERKSKMALANGYLVFNERTNSRAWFMPILYMKNHGTEVTRREIIDIEKQARNLTISGTQADMIKEMMVEIGYEALENGWDLHGLGQVHDELIYAYPTGKEYDFMFDYLKTTMEKVANRYLNVMKMRVEGEELLTWTI